MIWLGVCFAAGALGVAGLDTWFEHRDDTRHVEEVAAYNALAVRCNAAEAEVDYLSNDLANAVRVAAEARRRLAEAVGHPCVGRSQIIADFVDELDAL